MTGAEVVVLNNDKELGERVTFGIAEAWVSVPEVGFALRHESGTDFVEAIVKQEKRTAIVYFTHVGTEGLGKNWLVCLLG